MRSLASISTIRLLCSALVLQGLLTATAFSEEPAAGPAATDNPAQIKNDEKPPVIKFEQTISDLGQIAPGSSNATLYKFCNNGQGTLEINNISTTCGCTVADLEKKIYAPGECGEIKVTFNADRAMGLRVKHLYVSSNDPQSPKIELTIKGFIADKVITNPEKLEYYLKGKDANNVKLTVKSLDGAPFSITNFESTGDIVKADFNSSENATEIEINTRIDALRVGSTINGRVEIAVSHPVTPSLSVPFTILPKFRTDPQSLNIVNAETGKTIQKELWLLSNYEEDFEITNITSRQGAIKVLKKEKMGNRYKIELEITPPPARSVVKVFTDTLSISTKDGDRIDVSCRGFYTNKQK